MSPRAPARPCTWPGCPALVEGGSRCPDHAPVAWQGSTRRSRLPQGWAKTRRRILARDHGICHVCGGAGADAVDHVRPGDDHTDANLAAIHQDVPPHCHRRKSALEGQEASQRARGGVGGAPVDNP